MFSIVKKYEKVSPELVAEYSKLEESASIHEAMDKKGAMGGKIKPTWQGMRLCGPAFTVESRGGDNLMVHKALDMLQPGDVLVISSPGSVMTGGMWGGMMTASAKMKGCAGMLTDGSVRDTMLIKELDFPIFSAGVNVVGTSKTFPGTINHPIIMCGIPINPGDLVFADNDDVVIVPREIAQEVYDKTKAREDKEEILLKRILAGEGTTYNLAGFNVAVEALGLSEEP